MNESPGWASPGSTPPEPDRTPQTPPGEPPARPDGAAPEPGWSGQQPPAAPSGWGAPAGGNHPGGPHGRWHNSWQHPPAAKPGVIPLRPLDVSEILDGAVSTIRAHWRPALGIALGVAIALELVVTLTTGLWFRDNQSTRELESAETPTMSQVTAAYRELLSAQIVPTLAGLVASVLATALLTMVVSRAVLGQSVSVAEVWRDSRPLLLRLFGLSLLILVIVVLPVVVGVLPGLLVGLAGATASGVMLSLLGLTAGAVVAVWLWVRLSLSAPALMLEKQGISTALVRSAKLVRNSWWRIFGIQALAHLLMMVLAFVVGLVTSVIAAMASGDGLGEMLGTGATDQSWTYLVVLGIGAVISSTLTLPFAAGVTTLIYIDRRIRREALDLELARAAGASDADGPSAAGTPPVR
ncbi:hypothetical protein MTQ01_24690 [Streptomyces sp. XM4193]|uniref:DUF7544 domain-containing protein n=1 Tax=Streptomyces sp. XM4193 TaxID=2929782 RepID=UPI001FFB8A65|nr:hypothetical protein [Streptomyces sp. XM4193]MCK1799166.1 hypothetical protein [Streptomyces sp. XM4193]